MKIRFTFLFLVLTVCSALPPARSQTKPSTACCDVVKHALQDAQQIKVGMFRKDVERYFARGGGMVFRNHTVYVYPECDYIKLEVNFSFDAAVQDALSPKDVVTSVSKLAIDYPARD